MDRHNHASDKTERVGHCERVTSVVVPNSPADGKSSLELCVVVVVVVVWWW